MPALLRDPRGWANALAGLNSVHFLLAAMRRGGIIAMLIACGSAA
jgi:hypothetical protein